MDPYYSKVKEYLLDLNMSIVRELPEEDILVVDNESAGIKNLVLICSEPILIMEQHLFEVKHEAGDVFKKLLKKNREIVHGAFALDDSAKKVIFRDTLQLENLDLNELEASLQSLELLMMEYAEELVGFSKN